EVIYGNYDTYERMRALKLDSPTKGKKEETRPAPASAAPSAGKTRRKRRFPFRKTEELEADIAAEETRLREIERRLASPELYREGEKVKEITQAFEATKTRLAQLYEHWEEAVELNWNLRA